MTLLDLFSALLSITVIGYFGYVMYHDKPDTLSEWIIAIVLLVVNVLLLLYSTRAFH